MSATALEHLAATPVSLDPDDPFFRHAGWSLLLLSGDPSQRPEAQDLAVVVRELAHRAPTGTQVGIVTNRAEDAVKQRFSVNALPALVVLREGKVLSTLPRMQDWSVYSRAAQVFWGRQEVSP